MRLLITIGLVCTLSLSSCGLLGNFFGSPPKENPISPDEQYLPTGGNSSIELGPDQTTLVQDLEQERTKARELRNTIGTLTSENERLKSRLKSANTDLSQSREAKTKSDHGLAELTAELRELKTKVLVLQIKNAQLEQAKILMRLAAARRQEDAAGATTAAPMPMSGANR